MKVHRKANSTSSRVLERRLSTYLTAAGAVTAAMASEAQAVVVGNNTVQPWEINGFVNIDFNNDGQVDYQIDHDRVDLGGGNFVDYLQLDKNDVNGSPLSGENPFLIDDTIRFPLNGTVANDTAEAHYVTPTGTLGDYPAALTAGTPIGAGLNFFDFQEGTNFNSGHTIRANRLIDEDHTQVDTILGGLSASQVAVPTNGPNFTGLAPTDVRYLGVNMNLNGGPKTYGWIGIRITDQDQALGEVVGYAYETSGGPIVAGNVPEPGTLLTGILGGAAMFGSFLWKRVRRS